MNRGDATRVHISKHTHQRIFITKILVRKIHWGLQATIRVSAREGLIGLSMPTAFRNSGCDPPDARECFNEKPSFQFLTCLNLTTLDLLAKYVPLHVSALMPQREFDSST